jgi:hypothetical protein
MTVPKYAADAFAVVAVAMTFVASCSSTDGRQAVPSTTTPRSTESQSTQPAGSASAPSGGGTGSADGLDVTVSPRAATTVRPGGPPLEFTVTVSNTAAAVRPQIALVVSMGHCSCAPGPNGVMPSDAGTMRISTSSGQWASVPFDYEGLGTDFLLVSVVPPFSLAAGKSRTLTLDLALKSTPQSPLTKGESVIDATITNGSTHTAIGSTASMPITVSP